MRRLLNHLLLDPLTRIQNEHRAFLDSEASRRPDWKVMAVMVTSAVVLTLQHYFIGGTQFLIVDLLKAVGADETAADLTGWITSPETSDIAFLTWWALFSFGTYFFIPCAVLVIAFRENLADYGIKPHGALKDWPIYVVFFGVMFPLLFWVSTHEHFQKTYPFFQPDPRILKQYWNYFWLWEGVYFLQFVGLEFFFRGFMTHGLKHRFGVYSVFVMAVPYCMIHYGKPLLETTGALIAGVVLGFMSLKTRSIWMGAAIHMSVAISMDFLSLWRKGYFG